MFPHVFPVSTSQQAISCEQLARRIHKQVNSSAAQLWRRTLIVRQSGERTEDWDALLEQFDLEESVRVTRLEEGSVYLSWTNQHRSYNACG